MSAPAYAYTGSCHHCGGITDADGRAVPLPLQGPPPGQTLIAVIEADGANAYVTIPEGLEGDALTAALIDCIPACSTPPEESDD